MKDIKNLQESIREKVDAILSDVIAMRRDFHAHPELSGQEIHTAAKISDYLTSWGIPHETDVAGHGVVGVIYGKGPHTVAIRADIDALPIQEQNDVPYKSQNPGVMHACGHDIHTSVLLGTARVLAEMQEQLPGTVKLIFQPAEETTGGALPMIKAGCLENPRVDAIIGLHVEPDIPAGALEFRRGSMNAASNEFIITVKGVSSHGARPHNGVDAILVASQIVSALQSVASRNVEATDAVVVTVGQFNAGTAPNVLAGEVVMKGMIRTLNPATRALAVRRVGEIATSTAEAFGASVDVEMIESYPALINDDEIEGILEEAACQFFSPGQMYFRPESSMGAEDFSYFCDAVKGAYFNIGTRASSDSPVISLHNELYCPDEGCIRAGILMEVTGALAIFNKLNSESEKE